jgi:hypothetical protein
VLVGGVGAYVVASRNTTSSGASGVATTSAAPTPNGVESKAADAILADALTAAKAQTSMTMKSTGGGTGSTSFDLTLGKGVGGYGTIVNDKGKLEVVLTSDTFYLKATGSEWDSRMGSKASALIGDKWLSDPVSSTSDFADLVDIFTYDKALESFLTPSSAVTKGRVGDVNGAPAVALQSDNGTLWVATTGPALPLLIEQTGSSGGRAEFSGWSASVTLPVPPADQVIAFADVKKQTG